MFYGEHRYTIDEKGRLTIPARFRNYLQEGMFVTRGLEDNLTAYTREGFDELREKLKKLPMTSEPAQNMRRRLFGSTANLELDKQGRILLPQNLRELAQISAEVVMVGMDDYIEIWAAEKWEEMRVQIEKDSLANMAQLGI